MSIPIEEKLKILHQLELQKLQIANQLKLCNANIETAELEIIDEFESRQIKSMKLDGIGNFFIRSSSYPKVTDPQVLRVWMEKNGMPWEMVTMFSAMKLRGFYNERLEQGIELPPGVENFLKSSIVIKGE